MLKKEAKGPKDEGGGWRSYTQRMECAHEKKESWHHHTNTRVATVLQALEPVVQSEY